MAETRGNKKLHSGGSFAGDQDLTIQGGQGILLEITNLNPLGLNVEVRAAETDDTKGAVILPSQTRSFEFARFGSEPMSWTLRVSSVSDSFVANWKLFSTWIPGDPPNG